MRKEVLVLILLLALPTAFCAEIHGVVYDFELERTDAVVEINTIPKQTMVAKNGSYSFQVPVGSYKLYAHTKDSSVIEPVNITSDGSFVLDIILFPDVDFNGIFNTTDLDDEIGEEPKYIYLISAIILLIFAVILFFVINHLKNKAKKEEQKLEALEGADELDKVLDFIKKQGGRTTQKDLRKEFPSSEAKISLILTELEHKGKIEKIKKGRGNIIILKK